MAKGLVGKSSVFDLSVQLIQLWWEKLGVAAGGGMAKGLVAASIWSGKARGRCWGRYGKGEPLSRFCSLALRFPKERAVGRPLSLVSSFKGSVFDLSGAAR
jgi:hypothetical protein